MKDDVISRQAAIDALHMHLMYRLGTDSNKKRLDEWINSLPSAQPPALTCDGCRHVGTYDTDFPCSVCIRREKDYYEQERWPDQQTGGN